VTSTTALKPERGVIVALDVDTADEARTIVGQLTGAADGFKVGLQLFVATGPEFVSKLAAEHRVFLDLKFHDIPNTVAKAAVEAAKLGVWMFNVHASGGSQMMRRAADDVIAFCSKENIARPLMLGVTVLTSSDGNTLAETGIECEAEQQVSRLAKLTAESGLDGVVASPLEVATIRETVEQTDFLIVTPGIRTVSATNDDQKRVMTAGRAFSEGSNFIVVGRPVIEAADRRAALLEIRKEIDAIV
jgi:orotidine-5'-phosphate decarboxylase